MMAKWIHYKFGIESAPPQKFPQTNFCLGSIELQMHENNGGLGFFGSYNYTLARASAPAVLGCKPTISIATQVLLTFSGMF